MKNLQVGQKLNAAQARELYDMRNPEHGIFADFTPGRSAIVDGVEYTYVKNMHGAELLEFRDECGFKEYIHLNSWA